jgi:2-polyprenyl-3-methyl-5-hydroxy-6-metoxy-1,4-benzoquinol methylase
LQALNNEKHIPKYLFEDAHYLGKPAEIDQKIITRRIDILRNVKNFCNPDLDCVEIGCGNGASTLRLSPDFRTIKALEYFDGHRTTFEKLKHEWKVDNCDFELWNIEEKPYQKQYDRLISFEVIEHLEKEESVANYAKSLKSGGMGIISVPNKWWIFEQHGAKLPLLPWNRVPFFSWLPRPLHEKWANARIYTKSRIKKLLEKSGFEVVEMKYITAPMDVLPEGFLKRMITSTILKNDTTKIPFFSTSIFVVVRKR